VGSRIDPRVTVALTDQSLLGPGAVAVHYASNRPAVVGDDLRARRPGVATITATVTYHGGTATGTFVVKVSGGRTPRSRP
jgi:beta-glucosidase